MNTLGITRGTYLVILLLHPEAVILNVIPFWNYIQKQCFESNTILVLLRKQCFESNTILVLPVSYTHLTLPTKA